MREKEIEEKLRSIAINLFNSTNFLKSKTVKNYKFIKRENPGDFFMEVGTKEKEEFLLIFVVKSAGHPRFIREDNEKDYSEECSQESCSIFHWLSRIINV